MKLIDLAAKLVAFDTWSPLSNVAMADFISNFLEQAGFQVEQYPYLDRESVKKVNLIARRGGSESFLSLSGHMDTVAHAGGNWTCKVNGRRSNPLTLTQNGQRFYARGIADMKLFLAIAMLAGKSISESEIRKPFSLCFTADEEVGCVGVKRLVRQDGAHVGKYIIIGEPTDMVPLNAHKGYVYFSVNLEGRTGHSSDPRNGKSTIPALPYILEKLRKIELALRQSRTDNRFHPSYPTMNVGVVSTTVKVNDEVRVSSKNLIAGNCRLEVEIRTLPGQSGEEISEIIKSYMGEKHNGVNIQVKLERKPTPAMETPLTSEVVKGALGFSQKKLGVANFNTEGGVFTKAGSECVIWGPASIEQAHKPNEYVEARYLTEDNVDFYAAFIRKYCC